MVGQTRFHRGSNAQSLMDAAKVVNERNRALPGARGFQTSSMRQVALIELPPPAPLRSVPVLLCLVGSLPVPPRLNIGSIEAIVTHHFAYLRSL